MKTQIEKIIEEDGSVKKKKKGEISVEELEEIITDDHMFFLKKG
jgi:hypothetical protein